MSTPSTPKITIVVFCYRGEEDLLPMTLDCVKRTLPTASIHLYDDHTDPLKPATQNIFRANGIDYNQSTFDRRINLNGKDCVVGELTCMLEAMDKDDNTDGYVIKMDPDTLVLRPNLILDAIAKGAKWISHSSEKGHFAGMFYVIHRSILEQVHLNAQAMILPEDCAEDETIGAMCYIAAAKGCYSWTATAINDGPKKFAAFPIDTFNTPSYWSNVLYCAFAGHILTVGNTGVYKLPKSYQVVNCRDILWAFYNQDKAKSKCSNPEVLEKIECTPLHIVNAPNADAPIKEEPSAADLSSVRPPEVINTSSK